MSVYRILLSVLLSCGLMLPSGTMFAKGGRGSRKKKKSTVQSVNPANTNASPTQVTQQSQSIDNTPAVTSALPSGVQVVAAQNSVQQPENANQALPISTHSHDDLAAALASLNELKESELQQNDFSATGLPQDSENTNLSSGSNRSNVTSDASSNDDSSSSQSSLPSSSPSTSPSTSHISAGSPGSTIKKSSESEVESPTSSRHVSESEYKEEGQPKRIAPVFDPLNQSGLIPGNSSSAPNTPPTVRVQRDTDEQQDPTSQQNDGTASNQMSAPQVPSVSASLTVNIPSQTPPTSRLTSSTDQQEQSLSSDDEDDVPDLVPGDSLKNINDASTDTTVTQKDSNTAPVQTPLTQAGTTSVEQQEQLLSSEDEKLPRSESQEKNDSPTVGATLTGDTENQVQQNPGSSQVNGQDISNQASVVQPSEESQDDDADYKDVPEATKELIDEAKKQDLSSDVSVPTDDTKDKLPLTLSDNEQEVHGEQNAGDTTSAQASAGDVNASASTDASSVVPDVSQDTTPAPQQPVENTSKEQEKQPDTTTPDVKQEAANKPVEGTPEDVLPGLPSDNGLKDTKRPFNARNKNITLEELELTGNVKLVPVLEAIYGKNNVPKNLTYQQLVDKLKAHYAAFTAHDKLKAKVDELDQLMNKDVQSAPSRDIGMMSKKEQEHMKQIETLISDIYVVVVDLQKDGYLQGGWFATVMKSVKGHPVLSSVVCIGAAGLAYVGYQVATLPEEAIVQSTEIHESQEATPTE